LLVPVAYDVRCHKTVSQLSHSNALIPVEALCRRIDARGSGMELLGHLVLIGGCIALAGIFAFPAMRLLAQKLWSPH